MDTQETIEGQTKKVLRSMKGPLYLLGIAIVCFGLGLSLSRQLWVCGGQPTAARQVLKLCIWLWGISKHVNGYGGLLVLSLYGVGAFLVVFSIAWMYRRGLWTLATGMIWAIFILIYILPAFSGVSGPARRYSCQNNLKQLGVVLKLYENECHAWPLLSNRLGCLSFAYDPNCPDVGVYQEYLIYPSVMVCTDTPDLPLFYWSRVRNNPDILLDDISYFYLGGYVLMNDADMAVFADNYKKNIPAHIPMDQPLPVGEGKGYGGSNLIARISASMEDTTQAATIPTLIERPGTQHGKMGGNVLFLDGHVEFINYPGKWPMTEKTISLLNELDRMGKMPKGDETP